MKRIEKLQSDLRPILLSYSQPMHAEKHHSYYYDFEKKMNVIRGKDGMILPFVDSQLDQLCISTKTEALRESDDSLNEMLLISTKTYTQMESDDSSTINN